MFHFKLKSLGAIAVLGLSSCMLFGRGSVRMMSGEGIPAAEATVKTAKAENNNVSLSVSVQHLASPGKVENGAATYVVWAEPDGTGVSQNLGALEVDKKLNGTLNTVIPFETFKVFITAEPTAQITAPTGRELLAASVTRGKAG